ncbi:hypothetical protein SDC9_86105 [bioreactor metagenome]|uniref:Uncharacterized protein n=1 Tax=bioreactor metagenome TaxID=1076179 RepID=A0A644ZF18_9ZZZZ
MSDGNHLAIRFLADFGKPIIPQFPGSHLNGNTLLSSIPACLEVNGMTLDVQRPAKVAYEILVSVRFLTSQFKITMSSFTMIA